MKSAFVVDASVGLSWVVDSQATGETDDLLSEVRDGRAIVVPSLWFYEIANGLLLLNKRKKVNTDHYKRAITALQSLSPVRDDDGPSTAFSKIRELAEDHDLTIYDAVYLDVALRRELSLATRDQALRKAAKNCSLTLL